MLTFACAAIRETVCVALQRLGELLSEAILDLR